MNNQSPFDRGLLIPIGVGLFSLFGICVILFAGRLTSLRASVEEVPTATSFQFALIGTEPVVLTVPAEGSDQQLPTITPRIPTPRPLTTPLILPTSTISTIVPIVTLPSLVNTTIPSRTPTTVSVDALRGALYDDADYRIIYSGNWTTQTGVAGANNNTLHVSSTLGNSISFRFEGTEVRILYQSGSSLGSISLTLDDKNYELNQATATDNIWILPSVVSGTHSVTITHLRGGSVNIDAISIPAPPPTPFTPVPTITNTPLNQ